MLETTLCANRLWVCVHSVMFNCLTPATVAGQAPLSMGFSQEEYWNGFPFPFLGDLPDLGIKPVSRASPATSGGFVITELPYVYV